MTSSPIDCLPQDMETECERLSQQMAFIAEAEKLKAVRRQTLTLDNGRRENSAEHSWHTALMAMVLAEHSDLKNINIMRVIKMLLLHDIVEIDTGDTFLYDEKANASKANRETDCAKRIYGLLPSDQQQEFIALWQEFEARETPDAKFAAALDSINPLINHLITGGGGIIKHRVRTSQVMEKKKHIGEASLALWEYAKAAVKAGEQRGFYLSE